LKSSGRIWFINASTFDQSHAVDAVVDIRRLAGGKRGDSSKTDQNNAPPVPSSGMRFRSEPVESPPSPPPVQQPTHIVAQDNTAAVNNSPPPTPVPTGNDSQLRKGGTVQPPVHRPPVSVTNPPPIENPPTPPVTDPQKDRDRIGITMTMIR